MIPNYQILRTRNDDAEADIFGEFIDMNGNHLCVTGELPDRNNEADISCIPVGIYQVIPHNSPKHPDTWEISGVPLRSNILLHNLNWPTGQSDGCIGVGKQVMPIEGRVGISESVVTLNRLRTILPRSFVLEIKYLDKVVP